MPARRRLGPLARSLAWLGGGIVLAAGVQVPLLITSAEDPAWSNLIILVTALVYTATGLVAWRRRPSNGTGPLLVLGAFIWLLASLRNTGVPLLVAFGLVTQTLIVSLVIQLLLAFPSGRLSGLASRLTAALAWVACGLLQAPLYLFTSAPAPYDVLQIAPRPDLVTLGHTLQRWTIIAATVAAAAIMAVRVRRAEPAQRWALLPLAVYGVVAVELIPITVNLIRPLVGPLALFVIQLTLLTGVPLAFVLSLLRGGFRQTAAVEELAAWLGGGQGGRPDLQTALARTLGDPSLRLLFSAPAAGAYVDGDGAVVTTSRRPHRGLVEIRADSRTVGAIDYDATLIADPEPVRAAGQVVAIAVDHERLTAELLAHRTALRESRMRLVKAGDEERRRIARDLHDGLQGKLVALALRAVALGDHPTASAPVRSEAAQLRLGLDAAAGELRQLVHGVMPAMLIERGLYAATEDLVDRMPVPTTLSLTGGDAGLPAHVQSTAYFTISEGLSNALKHASASRLRVALDRREDELTIEVSDDGVGGAAPGGGVGLRGLADRLDVLGGSLALESVPAHGTRLRARVPCAR